MDPKDMVRQGYDQISYAYRADEEDAALDSYHGWIGELLSQLASAGGACPAVLDLGCGCGIPVARRLAASCAVTGVDLSPVQIERARKLVPNAELICADMSALQFAPARFDAVTAFYSIIHLPLAEQPGLFRAIFGWLRPGGLFMAILGSSDWTGTEENWLGAAMYWSHTGEAGYRDWLAAAGFEILWTRFIPEGSSGHCLFLAQKPGAA